VSGQYYCHFCDKKTYAEAHAYKQRHSYCEECGGTYNQYEMFDGLGFVEQQGKDYWAASYYNPKLSSGIDKRWYLHEENAVAFLNLRHAYLTKLREISRKDMFDV